MTPPTDRDTASSSAPAVPGAHRQAKYQVRFDWGTAGAVAVAADADVVVWVDALPLPTEPTEPEHPAVPHVPGEGAVLAAGLTNAPAVARWILDEQVRLGRRAMIALVGAGATASDGSPRFAVDDLLAAGAVVDELASLGIDYCSPEAAAASAAFTGLRGAVAHLLTASVSGQESIAAGAAPAEVAAGGRLGSSDTVTVLRASRQSGARPPE